MSEQQTTEEQAKQGLELALGRVKPLCKTVRQLPPPAVDSPMRRDDRDAAPYKPSQSVRRLLGVATEHLDAVYTLMVDAKVQHPGALFTLLRASIETAATATWLMTPNLRVERLRRTLCLARNNLNDQANVEREHLITAPRPFEERQDSIREAADRIQPGLQLSKVKSTEVLKDVEQATSPNERIGLLAAWQACSAFAHGRLWATLSLQDREVTESDDGDLLLRITGSTQALAWATLTAANATTYGIGRYQRAATNPFS